jgi:hypothetical protein
MRKRPRWADGAEEKTTEQAGISARSPTTSSPPANVERLLDDNALALFDSIRAMCGAGVIHDRAWWAVEAARLGTDWPGVLRSIEATVEICRRRAAPKLGEIAG